jgi:tetratricopeptide (TPR) repeat protein
MVPDGQTGRSTGVCVHCGGPVLSRRCSACELSAESRFVHRELVVLVVLVGVVVAGFMLTRAAARENQELRRQDSRVWFAAGERELQAGRSEAAVTALRRAIAVERDNRRYRLALAAALLTARQDDAARQVLIGVRRSSPENPDVNLQLARLERRHGAMESTIRYYQGALHGTWDTDRQNRRREVRVELVRYLLAHDQRARALSELLILTGNLPDELAPHLEAGTLLQEAGDSGRALDQFQRALQLDSTSRSALVGAGEAAFELGDYAAARRFFDGANPAPSARLNQLREVADLVLERDPLRPGLPLRDRRQRWVSSVAHAKQRLAACLSDSTQRTPSQRSALESLQPEIGELEADLRRGRDSSLDSIQAGLSLIYRIERQTMECHPRSPLDRALLLIAQRHEIDRQ